MPELELDNVKEEFIPSPDHDVFIKTPAGFRRTKVATLIRNSVKSKGLYVKGKIDLTPATTDTAVKVAADEGLTSNEVSASSSTIGTFQPIAFYSGYNYSAAASTPFGVNTGTRSMRIDWPSIDGGDNITEILFGMTRADAPWTETLDQLFDSNAWGSAGFYFTYDIAAGEFTVKYSDGNYSVYTFGTYPMALTGGDTLYVDLNWDSGQLSITKNSDPAVVIGTFDPTDRDLSSGASSMDYQLYIAARFSTTTATFAAGTIGFDYSQNGGGRVGFADIIPVDPPTKAEPSDVYEVTGAGPYDGKSGYVGDLLVFGKSVENAYFLRMSDPNGAATAAALAALETTVASQADEIAALQAGKPVTNITATGGSTRNMTSGDSGYYVVLSSSNTSDITLQVRLNSFSAIEVGTEFDYFFKQSATEKLLLTAEVGVTLLFDADHVGSDMVQGNGHVKLKKIDTDTWAVTGATAINV